MYNNKRHLKKGTSNVIVLIALVMSFVLAISVVLVACKGNNDNDTVRTKFNKAMDSTVNIINDNGILDESDGVEFANKLKDLPQSDWDKLTVAYNDLIAEEGFVQLNINIELIKNFFVQLVSQYTNYDNNDEQQTNPRDIKGFLYLSYDWIIGLGGTLGIAVWSAVKTGLITKIALTLISTLSWVASIPIVGPIFLAWLAGNSIYLAGQMISAVLQKKGVDLGIGWWLFIPHIKADIR